MRFLALDMGDETHATGVMFVGGVVQTLGFVQNHAGFGRMGFAGGGILHSALLGAGSWTIPVFPCCLKCLERRCEAAIPIMPRDTTQSRSRPALTWRQAAKACGRLRQRVRRREALRLPTSPAERNGRG